MPNLYDHRARIHPSAFFSCFTFRLCGNAYFTTTFKIKIIMCHNYKYFVMMPTLLRIFGFLHIR